MARPNLPQFEPDYDFYKMRQFVDEMNRWIDTVEAATEAAGGGNGGGGTDVHNDLTGRDAADAHPISAITGLAGTLAANAAAIASNAANIAFNAAGIAANSAAIAAQTLASLADTDLTGQVTGDLLFNVDGTNWNDTAGALSWDPVDSELLATGAYRLAERAAATASIAAQAQLWMRDDVPNVSMFTNDAGQDFRLNVDPIDQFEYNFNTSTAGTDPGSGFLAFNNADPTLVGLIVISDIDSHGITIDTDVFTKIVDAWVIRVVDRDSLDVDITYTVNNVVDSGGFYTFTVFHQEGAVLPANNADLSVKITRDPFLDISTALSNGTLLSYNNTRNAFEDSTAVARDLGGSVTSLGSTQSVLELTQAGGGVRTLLSFSAAFNTNNDLLILFSNGGDKTIQTNVNGGPLFLQGGNGNEMVRIMTTLGFNERAAALADVLSVGQVWVRNDAPNTLMFTDDLGNDFVIGGSLGINNLQDAYDAATTPPQITTVTGDPFAVAAIDATAFFLLEDTAASNMLELTGAGAMDIGDAGVNGRFLNFANLNSATNRPSLNLLPDTVSYTVTSPPGIIEWSGVLDNNVGAAATFGGFINLVGRYTQAVNGFAFNNGLVFNHASTYENDSGAAANFGPIFTLVDQPLIRSTGGARTMSIYNAVRAQPRFGPHTGGGSLAITSVTQYETAGSLAAGSSVTTWRNIRCAGVALGGGTIGTYFAVDIVQPTVVVPTTSIGIQCDYATGGGRTFIQHLGTAPSTFAGSIRMNDAVETFYGTTSGAQLSRVASSGLRMEGFGGANNEGIDFGFQNVNFVQMLPTPGGLGFKMNSLEFAFGPGADPDGTNNWVMIFAPGLRATNLAGDYSEVLFSSASAISVAHAISNFATWTVNAPSIVLGGGSIVNAANVLIQTNMAQGTNRYGLLVTSSPTGGTLNYCARFQGTAGVRIDGILEHTGTTVGFYGTTPTVQSAAYTPTNVTPDRAFDADATTLNELADIVGTMIADLQLTGIYA